LKTKEIRMHFAAWRFWCKTNEKNNFIPS